MEWAVDIFPIENRTGKPGFVRRIWRTRSVDLPSFISVAMPTWQIVLVHNTRGVKDIVARGPETLATRVTIPQDVEFLGIEFELGAFLPDYSPAGLVDSAEALLVDSRRSFRLIDSRFETPTFDNADVFVDRLVRSGILVRDPVVEQALKRRPVSLSDRSIQRRFVRSTGLTYATLRQIERAKRAASLLRSVVSILDMVDREGYSDQAHLTRSLKRFLGATPGGISKADH